MGGEDCTGGRVGEDIKWGIDSGCREKVAIWLHYRKSKKGRRRGSCLEKGRMRRKEEERKEKRGGGAEGGEIAVV